MKETQSMPAKMRLYHFMKAEHALQAIERGRVKTSDLSRANDPFEFLPEQYENSGEEEQRLRHRAIAAQMVGLLCFSETNSEPLLWGHYADGCKGICLGLDFDVPTGDPASDMIQKVKYCRSRKTTELDNTSERLLIKSHNWSYEREWRAFTMKHESPEPDPVTGLHYCSMPSHGQMVLREILIGFNCVEESIADRLAHLIRRYDPRPEIFCTRRSLSAFEVERVSVP